MICTTAVDTTSTTRTQTGVRPGLFTRVVPMWYAPSPARRIGQRRGTDRHTQSIHPSVRPTSPFPSAHGHQYRRWSVGRANYFKRPIRFRSSGRRPGGPARGSPVSTTGAIYRGCWRDLRTPVPDDCKMAFFEQLRKLKTANRL